MRPPLDLDQAPGHLIRRLHQIAVAAFVQEAAEADITPVQFGLLKVLSDHPGMDQISLAKRVALDAATSGSVIARLEAKGWIVRSSDSRDRRRKLLQATPLGLQTLEEVMGAVSKAQDVILAPLAEEERVVLMRLLSKLVAGHEAADAAGGGGTSARQAAALSAPE